MIDEINVSVIVRLTNEQVDAHAQAIQVAHNYVVNNGGNATIKKRFRASARGPLNDGVRIKLHGTTQSAALAIAKFIEAVCKE